MAAIAVATGIVAARPTWSILARCYFAVQAVAGAVWWILVFTVDPVREATLGGADPRLVAVLDIPLFVVGSALAAAGSRRVCWALVPWTGLVAAVLAVAATLTGRAGWGAVSMIAALCGSLFAWMLLVWGRIPAERALVGPLGFQVSRSAPPHRQLARTFGQIAVFWVLFLAVIPFIILWAETRWGLTLGLGETARAVILIAGLLLLLLASGLGIWSAVAMSTRGDGTPLPAATARKLVIAGPYRFVRNPMALAGMTQAAAVGMMLGSWMTVTYALAGAAYWNWLVRPIEEAELESRFGQEFRAYAARVRCWAPRFGPAARSLR